MTMGESQSEELSRLIRIETHKTIKMLELFMKSSNNNERIPIMEDTKDTEEVEEKEKEDFLNSMLEITNETNEDISTHKVNYGDEDELFTGIERTYPTISTQYNKGFEGNNDDRTPFSKYVEECIKMNNSVTIDPNSTPFYDTTQFDKNRTDFINSQIDKNTVLKSKSVIGSNKKSKIKIQQTQQIENGFGKFFKVKLKPLQHGRQNKQNTHYDSTSELDKNNHSDNDRPGLIGVK